MQNINDLIIRINTETSILFLGQAYEKELYVNVLREILPNNIREKVFGQEELISYAEMMDSIIDFCDEVPNQKELVLQNIIKAEDSVEDERFMLLKDMGWCGVATSLMCQLPDFSEFRPVLNRADVKNDYFTRKNPYITYLFGKAGSGKANIPLSFEEKMVSTVNKNEFWNKITTRLKMSGILVIDGWNPLKDWLTIEDINALISLPKESVYIFGATEEMKKLREIKKLVAKKILMLFDISLYELLCQSGYQISELDNYDNILEDDGLEFTIDSVYDKADSSIQCLSYQIVNQLDSSINILDNIILDNPDYIDKEEFFIRFMSTENNLPLWGGYASGFYFHRDKDDELLEKVENQIRNTNPSNNRVILLEGNNSSGKTTTLGNLAFRIREKKKYPVIFITSKMKEKDNYEDLERLLKNHINAKMGARKTVIIWDKNTYGKDDIYEHMRRNLEECNVVVVGSRYIVKDHALETKEKFETVTLDDNLSKETEMQELRKVLQKISTKYTENFDLIVKTITNVSDQVKNTFNKKNLSPYADTGNWFLLIFNRLFEELHDIQKRSINNEVRLAQRSITSYLRDYSSRKFDESIYSKIYKVLEFSKPDATEYYEQNISRIFDMIAVAGKYGLALPAMIIFRAFENSVGEWQDFIKNIEQNSVILVDMLDDGIMMIRFRRALEASLFLEHRVNNFEELLDIEISSLLMIISNTNFSDMDGVDSEALQVVNLIRKFGPNGPDPNRYRPYFQKIAEVINVTNNDINDEAILVASHMLRETFNGDIGNDEENKMLLDARKRLRRAINQYGNRSKSQQLVRLKVELSTNLLKSLPAQGNINKNEREIFYEIQTYLESAMVTDITKFSVGVFLDAALRVYGTESIEKKKSEILSRMLQIVDDVNELQFTVFSENIHSKILTVLTYAQKYEEIEEENKRLLDEGSDVGIYRHAMKELDGYNPINIPSLDEKAKISRAIQILEENIKIVMEKPRSLYLYIRLLWIIMTGYPPFTEKQFVALSDKQWEKINYLCEFYIENEESQKKPFPYFVTAVYRFREGNIRGFKEHVEITREFRNRFSAYVTYAILCDEGGAPKKEDVILRTSINRRSIYSAVFENKKYGGVEAYFKDSNFKDVIDIFDGKRIGAALVGFNLYGIVVYSERDLYGQLGGKK